MESKILSIQQVEILDQLEDKKFFPTKHFNEVPPLLGLRSIDPPYWYDRCKLVSYLEIVDEKKWFLAKIKYGI